MDSNQLRSIIASWSWTAIRQAAIPNQSLLRWMRLMLTTEWMNEWNPGFVLNTVYFRVPPVLDAMHKQLTGWMLQRWLLPSSGVPRQDPRIRLRGGRNGERFARAYNGGLMADPPAGSNGREPLDRGSEEQSPMKLKGIHFFDAQRRAKFGPLSRISRHIVSK